MVVYIPGSKLAGIVTELIARISSETIKSKHAEKTAMNRSAVATRA